MIDERLEKTSFCPQIPEFPFPFCTGRAPAKHVGAPLSGRGRRGGTGTSPQHLTSATSSCLWLTVTPQGGPEGSPAPLRAEPVDQPVPSSPAKASWARSITHGAGVQVPKVVDAKGEEQWVWGAGCGGCGVCDVVDVSTEHGGRGVRDVGAHSGHGACRVAGGGRRVRAQ